MTTRYRSLDHIDREVVVDAVRWEVPDGLKPGAITAIRDFVLQNKTEHRVGVVNERILDVVCPIGDWDLAKGVATLLIVDPGVGARWKLPLGWWLLRHKGGWFTVLPDENFVRLFEKIEEEVVVPTDEDVLADLIETEIRIMENQALSWLPRHLARSITRAGWSKEGTS